jgi:hypothetical protein
MNLTDLLDRLELPPTEVAETAWDDAHRRLVRRRGLAAGAAAAVAVGATVAVIVAAGSGPDAVPSPAPTPPSSQSPAPFTVTQRLVIDGAWRQLLVDFPRELGISALEDAAPLSTDPVPRAALAIGDPQDEAGALVLGEDGVWRRVDVEGLVPVTDGGGYTSPVVRPTSLSPDGTQVALPQPDALVVVDLTDGSSRRYGVPGPANTYAIWADESHVLVAEETAHRGTMVDLRDGSMKHSAYGPSTAFLGHTTLTWKRRFFHSALDWGDRRDVPTDANNAGGLFPEPPLVRDGVVVGVMCVCSGDLGLPFPTWGIVAVDGSTGKVLAYLPVTRGKGTKSELLGWDGDRPVIGLSIPDASSGLYTVAWDWRQGRLVPLGYVPSDWVSWGSGKLP